MICFIPFSRANLIKVAHRCIKYLQIADNEGDILTTDFSRWVIGVYARGFRGAREGPQGTREGPPTKVGG